MTSREKVREIIIKKLLEKPERTHKQIAKELKVHRNTITNALKSYKEDLNVKKKSVSGRPKGFASPKKAKKIVAHFKRNPNISLRKLAGKVGCSASTVNRVKSRAGYKTYKVQTTPDRNAEKNLVANKRAKTLKKDFFQENQCCVMDDETYVLCDFSQLPGQEFYTACGRGNVEKQFRTKLKSKFPKKFLVWQAICSCGDKSKFFITTGTINSNIYIKECLQKRLLPFMRQHRGSFFFWPDLASCHYSKATIEWYEANNIQFVPREANPPNCPELRPIERYWALVKKNLKSTKKEARDIDKFKIKWRAASEKITNVTIKSMMESVPAKIALFCKNN